MKHQSNKQRKVILFSRWSRKSYAVFASLHKVVNIMRLTVDICMSSFAKNKTIISELFIAKNYEGDGSCNIFDDLLDEEVLLLEFYQLSFATNYSENNISNYINPFTNLPKSIFYQSRIWTLFL